MKLKPFRDYSEHEVVNLFATQEGDLEGGSVVTMAIFNPDDHSSYGAVMPNLAAHAHTSDYIVNARVTAAHASASGTGVIGITLFDVKSVLAYPFNTPAYLSDPTRLAEQQVVPSGRAVPILKRGLVEISGFVGTPYPGAAATVAGTGNLGVSSPGTAGAIGTWLSSSGVDGAALLQVNCI